MAKKTYTCELKLKVVRAVEENELRLLRCRECQIAEYVFNRSRHEVRLRREAAFTPHEIARVSTDYETWTAEFERVCGQFAVENAALKRLCSVSSLSPSPIYKHVASRVSQPIDPPTLHPAGRQPLMIRLSSTPASRGVP